MTDVSYRGIASLQSLFALLTDERISNTLLRRETKDVARIFDVRLPPKYLPEVEIIALIRAQIENTETSPPICDCAGRGTRWEKADRGEPVLVHIDPAINRIYAGAVELLRERFEYLASLTQRLRFEFVDSPDSCDILFDVQSEEESDGRSSVLGFTQYYNDGTEDLDVFGDARWSVRIAMDPAEYWWGGFIRTVGLHEILHAVGLSHIDLAGNLLQSYYAGVQYTLGDEELAALINLYGKAEALAA